MKILLCTRNNYLENMAGDSVQLLTTAKYLRSKGLTADINNGQITDYSKYDIIHLFNLTRISETYNYYKIAKQSGKATVITPIYWNLSKYYKYTGSIDHCVLWEGYSAFRSEILSGCDMIYPSSIKEMELLKNEYGEHQPYTVVYNCVDCEISVPENNNRDNSFILCAARVCPRKNQLALAKVCSKLGEKLVLAGEANNKEYLEKCLKFDNVSYVGYLQTNELIKLYSQAKLHVLCSFIETPGLSSLEAGACGCNIVSTSEGSTEEYFKNMALYCNPYDETDIYNSVKAGLEFNMQPNLREHILQNFRMENCLQKLIDSYFKVLK